MRTKLRFTRLLEPGQRQRPLQNLKSHENSWLTRELQCTCWAKKIHAQANCILFENPGTQRWLRPMEKCKQTRRHRFLFTILASSWLCNFSKIRLQFDRLENSAKNTDSLMSGQAVKNHDWPNRRRNSMCKTDNFVPLVVPGLSSSSGCSTSTLQDFSSPGPASDRRDEQAPGNWSDTEPITQN